MNRLKKIVYGLFLTAGSIVLLLIIASVIIMLLGIRVELNTLRTPVEIALEKTVGRKVHFRGDLSLIPTLWPTLEVQDVQIDNPPQWPPGVFADVKLMRVQLGLLPLLRQQIHLGEVTIKGITLNLQNNRQGVPNWLFKPVEEVPHQDQKITTDDGFAITFAAINTLALADILLNYQDQQLNRHFRLRLNKIQGSALSGEPFQLDVEGDFENKQYQFHLAGGSISDLRERSIDWPILIEANIAGTPINAQGTLIRQAEPELHAEFTVGHVDIGATLAWLKLASDIQASTDALTVRTELRGKSLSELLALSGFKLTIDQAIWTLTDANTSAQLPITVKQGQLTVNPGKPVLLILDSQVDQEPVLMHIRGAKLADYGVANKQHPLQIKLKGADAALTLKSRFALPIGKQNLGFTIKLLGERLDSFDELLNIDLPPVGPYSLAGGFAVTEEGYAIKNLLLQVGSSHLQGDLSLATTQTPPKLTVQLESKQLQINDFNLQGWSARSEESNTPEDTKNADSHKKNREESKKNVRKFLTPEVFQSLTANIDIQVKQVLSGADVLGKGSLLLTLEQGRLSLNPLQVESQGGAVELQVELYPTSEYVEVSLLAKANKFDYGILARRIDENSETAGKLSLDVDLTAKVADKRYLLANGSGHFDFAVWPGDMDADVFDLWAVSLLNAIVIQTDKESSSKVNCAIAGFSLKDGLMQQNVLFVDTSRMQIEGTADVNFKSKEIELYVEPKAKRPEFFSLATPVKVTGNFADFGIGINPAQLAGSVVRFVASPVLVPFHRLFSISTPADGVEACEKAWKMRNTLQQEKKKFRFK